MKWVDLIGAHVELEILDHSTSDSETPCSVIGKVCAVNEQYVKLLYWGLPYDDLDVQELNQEVMSILRSAVLSITILKPTETVKGPLS